MSKRACASARQAWGFLVVVSVTLSSGVAEAAVVAKQDFDGGEVNLVSGFNPATDNLDGGPGDWFGVGNRGAWPQGYPPGMPFGFADDSVVSVSDPNLAPFPNDLEAAFGQARPMEDDFFGISDTREWELPEGIPPLPTATWTFDISDASALELSIGFGSSSDGSQAGFGGYALDAEILFKYQIDDGPVATAFRLAPNPSFSDFMYRLMDDGDQTPTEGNGPLEATGDSAITRTLVDTDLAATNSYVDKSPASGAGAGLFDTFTTALSGTGSQLVLTLTANLDFEGFAFDNILIEGEAAAGLPGDFNNDLKVDAADYTDWRDNLGAVDETSINGNGDGLNGVDAADYTLWKTQFGAPGSGGIAGGAVPEPTSIVLLAAGLIGLILGRRSSR